MGKSNVKIKNSNYEYISVNISIKFFHLVLILEELLQVTNVHGTCHFDFDLKVVFSNPSCNLNSFSTFIYNLSLFLGVSSIMS